MTSQAIQKLRDLIDASDNIVFFGGAGVSTESGVPDFRSETGLYQAQSRYGRSPEELVSASFFRSDPETFFDYYKNNMIYPQARPNRAHRALAELERQGKLKAVITQNIDGLHQLAGSRNIYELHGSELRNYCMDCGAAYDLDYILDPACCLDQGAQTSVPRCSICGGIVRPDVVLYEEMLDEAVTGGAVQAISQADLLLIGGTSLVVYPAAGFLNCFRGSNLVLINKSETGFDTRADLVIHEAIGTVLGEAVGIPG